MFDIDWGSVPAWLGAGSLLLAYRIFLRDRKNSERAQIDRVANWVSANEAEGKDLTHPFANVKWSMRNASDLPVWVVQLAYRLHTIWRIDEELDLSTSKRRGIALPTLGSRFTLDPTEKPQNFYESTGTDVMRFWRELKPPLLLIPEETQSEEEWVSLNNIAPDGVQSLRPSTGVQIEIDWVLLTDNAGRRWEVQPGKGRRPIEVTWMTRKRFEYPMSWQQGTFSLDPCT
jgi:hypothetical protein